MQQIPIYCPLKVRYIEYGQSHELASGCSSTLVVSLYKMCLSIESFSRRLPRSLFAPLTQFP